MRSGQWICAIALGCLHLCSVRAASEATAPDLLREGERAYQRGDFAQARDVFREFVLRYPDDEAVDVARFRMGQAALALGSYDAASNEFQAVAASEGPLRERGSYFAGLAAYRAGEFGSADVVWSETVRGAVDEGIAAHAQYGRAWCAIRQTNWHAAREALERLELLFPAEPLALRARGLRRALSRADELPRRSPAKAKWLSTFLPGSGQIYAGREVNGLVSTALSGAFIYAVGRAARDGRWLDAGFLYLLGSRFYFGGRQNAEKFAGSHNERVLDDFLEDLSRYED